MPKQPTPEAPVAFEIRATPEDVAEAMDDLQKQGAQIRLEKITDNDMIYIATIWHCLNHLKNKGYSKDELAELTTIAYLGADVAAEWMCSKRV